MKKKLILPVFLFIACIVLVSISLASAATFSFKKEIIHNVVPAENISIPASYYLTIKNINQTDEFRIYSFLDMELTPEESFQIEAGEEKTITVIMMPSTRIKERCGFGPCGVQYYIKSNFSGTIEDNLDIKVASIDKIINITFPEVITRDDTSFSINVTNTENINLEKISLSIDWNFGNATQNISLEPETSEILSFNLDKTKIEKAEAGNYTLKLIVNVNDKYSYDIQQNIALEEFAAITTSESLKRGFLGYTQSITKKNDGNLAKLVTIETIIGKFRKIFTRYSVEAAYENSTIEGVKVGWQRELEPGESFTVELKTNYSWLVLILVVIIVVVTLIYLMKRPRIIIKKKVYKVKAKGGQFALKPLIAIKNVGIEANDVKCIDHIPRLTKIHERFGTIKPDVVEKNKLEWHFGSLALGEEKIVSYIIYSDVMPVGPIILPKATITFVDSTGKKHALYSNTVSASGAAE